MYSPIAQGGIFNLACFVWSKIETYCIYNGRKREKSCESSHLEA